MHKFRLATLAAPALAGGFGALHATAFAPWNRWWLETLALAALFALLQLRPDHDRGGRALLLTFVFGLGHFGVGISWVFISMHTYGGMPAPLAALATLAFCALLSSYAALALAAVYRWVPQSRWAAPLAVPAAWALAEWIRAIAFSGFPWLATGYAHVDSPLAGFAPLAGVNGVSLSAALLAACTLAVIARPTHLGHRVSARGAVACFMAILLLLIGGEKLRAVQWTVAHGEPLRVSLAQGGIPQDVKFEAGGFERSLSTYLQLAHGDGSATDLVVLPESVLPVPLTLLPDEVPQALVRAARARGAAVIFGVFLEPQRDVFVNSAVAFDRHGVDLPSYGKRHLVPFGEFVPSGFRWFVDLMNMPIGDQGRGAAHPPNIAIAGQKIAINICYEDLFGDVIADAWHDRSNAPTLMLNLSNLGWFGDSLALPQHLQIARMRVLETGLPMLRATNTGATAIISANGKVQAQLPFLAEGVLEGRVQGMKGETFYVVWRDAPLFAACALLLALSTAAGWRKATP